MTACSVDQCDRPIKHRGMCARHYQSFLKYGDPLKAKPKLPNGSRAAFIRANVGCTSDECLLWPFQFSDRFPYPGVIVNGVTMAAHRYMCTLAHGNPSNATLEVAHSCGNSRCVNPRHLRWATRKENHADKIKHGTTGRYGDCGHAKLTPEAVLEIRASEENCSVLAKKFGVDPETVRDARKGRTWSYLAPGLRRAG